MCSFKRKSMLSNVICGSAGVKVNLNKTKIMEFCDDDPLRSFRKLSVNGIHIEVVSLYDLLVLTSILRPIYRYSEMVGNSPCTDMLTRFDNMIIHTL